MLTRRPSTFDLLPAIDLRAGRVVRLSQGDFAREQVYDEDPSATARQFIATGARWIHVVDLDGAVDGRRRQTDSIAGIVRTIAGTDTRLQVAGGLRDAGAVASALDARAHRVVLGTAAITDPALVGELVERHGSERIAVAIDVRDGQAVGGGWVPGAVSTPWIDALDRLADAGVRTFVVTAIARDGLLGGPDLDLLHQAVARTDAAIVASAGIASLADVEAVRAAGCSGAIIGRALYDGRIDLSAALALVDAGG